MQTVNEITENVIQYQDGSCEILVPEIQSKPNNEPEKHQTFCVYTQDEKKELVESIVTQANSLIRSGSLSPSRALASVISDMIGRDENGDQMLACVVDDATKFTIEFCVFKK